jgi:hypothetical protein
MRILVLLQADLKEATSKLAAADGELAGMRHSLKVSVHRVRGSTFLEPFCILLPIPFHRVPAVLPLFHRAVSVLAS